MLLGLWHAHVGWLFVHAVTDWARYIPDLLREPAAVLGEPPLLRLGRARTGRPGDPGRAPHLVMDGRADRTALGGLVRIFFVHHVTWSVNSICHYYGSQPFESRDEARNNPWLAILSLGESWHNNHHAFPNSADNQLHWWQLDICGRFIRSLEAGRLAWNVKVPSPQLLEERRARN